MGLTNDEAAAQLGIKSPNIISMWRMGRTPVSITRLPQLAHLLSVDMGDLFVLWLMQERLRNPDLPASVVETIQRRLATKNETVLLSAVRVVTRHTDPHFGPAKLDAVMRALV